jgi:hypothetical protein
MHFREEPVTPVYRHWMCEQVGCNGELLSTGERGRFFGIVLRPEAFLSRQTS